MMIRTRPTVLQSLQQTSQFNETDIYTIEQAVQFVTSLKCDMRHSGVGRSIIETDHASVEPFL